MQDFDWDDAYANGAHIADAAAYPGRWEKAAAAFRAGQDPALQDLAYGPGARNRFDLFLPDAPPAGLAVFVHGGYWMKFAPSFWSHLAAGPLRAGWAVAMPGYTLAPEARIARIGAEIAAAIGAAAARVPGPIRLTGHSAGGHLAARMACAGSPLAPDLQARLARVVSISGLHDLGPLARTAMNAGLHLDAAEIAAESPALLAPLPGVPATAWVGGDERPEFLRQARLLAEAWPDCTLHVAPGRHHFDVIDGLADPASPLCRALLDG